MTALPIGRPIPISHSPHTHTRIDLRTIFIRPLLSLCSPVPPLNGGAGWLTDKIIAKPSGAARLRAVMLGGWAIALLSAVLLWPCAASRVVHEASSHLSREDDPGSRVGEISWKLPGNVRGDASSSQVGDISRLAAHQGSVEGPRASWFESHRRSMEGSDRQSPWFELAPSIARASLYLVVPALGISAALIIIPALPDLQRGIAADDDLGRATMCAAPIAARAIRRTPTGAVVPGSSQARSGTCSW